MMHRSLALVIAAAFSLPGWSIAQSHRAAPAPKTPPSLFSRNLLANGGIEAVTEDNKKVPGWSLSDALSEAAYGSEGGEWDWGLSGCPTCSKHYLRLAFSSAVHDATSSQTVDVSPASAQIDAGKVTAQLSAWLGAFLNSDTTATVEVSFLDASGKVLGTLSTDTLDTSKLPKAPSGSTGLQLCQKSGPVPAGTRKMVYTFHGKATGNSGDYLALGDNFSLELTSAAA